MSDVIRASLDGVREFTDMDTVIGNAIHTPSGVTVIPVSKLTVGFAGGGVDFGGKRTQGAQSFGTGSGSGVTITPIAFLTVGRDAEVSLIHVNSNFDTSIERVTQLIEHSPEIVKKIKDTLS